MIKKEDEKEKLKRVSCFIKEYNKLSKTRQQIIKDYISKCLNSRDDTHCVSDTKNNPKNKRNIGGIF